MTSSTSDLIFQMETHLAKKSKNPAKIISDPLIGYIVFHDNWRYTSQFLTEAFRVAKLWSEKAEARRKSKCRRFCSLCFKNA